MDKKKEGNPFFDKATFYTMKEIEKMLKRVGLGILAQRPGKVKHEFLSQHFFGYFRLLPYDFLFKKANHFIDIDYALLLMKLKSTK